ncbi:MAG TPA: twin-arginine translocation pathway signal protein [Kaistiaceae bacterium]|nr:twin-arginine translocation pathway signal protein [Kaistiaceae bacterium]
MSTRRKFLLVLGGSAVILAAGAAGFALTRTPHAALKPWRDAGTGDTAIVRALSYAILAPSPHNLQPWAVELLGPEEAALHCRLDRRLPAADPFDRQTVIGLGCFLETLRIAAREAGYRAEITPFPEGAGAPRLDARPVARIRLVAEAGEPDPLFAAILERRTNRGSFDTARPVPAATLDEFARLSPAGAAVLTTTDAATVATLRDVTWRAFETEMLTPAPLAESNAAMRFGKAEIEAAPDGLAMSGAMLEALSLAGILSPATMGDTGSFAFRSGLDMWKKALSTSMAFLWITTPVNDRAIQIAVGAVYMRAHLAATLAGLAFHPLSQALEEYPEMAGPYREVHDLLAPPGHTVQMLVRLGYAPAVAPSPRWPLAERMVGA